MSFEIREKDLLARIGRLKTKSGTIETPLLFPVVNPSIQPITPKEMHEKFGFEAIIANAYILRKRGQNKLTRNSLHDYLDFKGIIMTDSGAYQILVYGDVAVTPREIVEYQEMVGSDIATILDIPTAWKVKKERARQTVNETWKRGKEFFKQKTRDDILWVGPVQGGRYLDLVTQSSREMGKLPFDIHALGSPTEVMERYRFDVLVDMIMTAKMNLPFDRPLHLFGAGHPFMFSLAVALGCDFFDSAAYALYAKEGRYMTEVGTARLNELEYFPCTCPRCAQTNPREVSDMPQIERQRFLAEHNLYVCAVELRRIKQAIKVGRLWELLQTRAHAHPVLHQALKQLGKYEDFLERYDPAVKSSGLFFFDSLDLTRPEVVRHRRRLAERYVAPKSRSLLLLPQTRSKPFHKSTEFDRVSFKLQEEFRKHTKNVHICFYTAPFGIVPYELDEVYPLSQYEIALPFDAETVSYVASQAAQYVSGTRCRIVILVNDPENWGETVMKAVKKACLRKNIRFESINLRECKESVYQNVCL